MNSTELAILIDGDMRKHSPSNTLCIEALMMVLATSIIASKREEKTWNEVKAFFHEKLDVFFDCNIRAIEQGRMGA